MDTEDTEQTLTDFEIEMLNLRDTARAVGVYAVGVLIAGPTMIVIFTSLIPAMSIAPLASVWLAACYISAVSLLGASWLTLCLRLDRFASRRKQSRRGFVPILMVSAGTIVAFVFAGSVVAVSVTEVIEALPNPPRRR